MTKEYQSHSKKIHIFIREVYLPWRIGGVNMPKS